MNSSQMEKYVWASVVYYAVAAVGFVVVFISISVGGFFWGFLHCSGIWRWSYLSKSGDADGIREASINSNWPNEDRATSHPWNREPKFKLRR
jgi:polyferredoxin